MSDSNATGSRAACCGDVYDNVPWCGDCPRNATRSRAAEPMTDAQLVSYWKSEADRFRNVVEWIAENVPAALELCPFKADDRSRIERAQALLDDRDGGGGDPAECRVVPLVRPPGTLPHGETDA